MTTPTAPPPAADPTEPVDAARPTAASPLPADRFFRWVSDLGIARSDGWLGGVAAGIAARLRIDPLIVRGVLVVATLFGLPVIFLYAIAWALLPDVEGRIHARDLLNRHFQPVQWGVLAMAVVGLIPTAPLSGRLFGLGYDSWSALSAITWIIGLAVVGGLLFLIVRAARRTPGASAPDPSMASTDQAAPAASAPFSGSGTAEGADATLPRPAPEASRPAPPAPLAAGPQSPEDLDAWRAQHAAWKEQDQAWRRQQQDADRSARDQARRERQSVASAFAAEASERRRMRRSSNPRAHVAFVAAVMGFALVVGAMVGLGGSPVAVSLGLLSAGLVLAIGMIVAGVLRRRSGFLAFLTMLALASGAATGAASVFDDLTLGWTSITNVEATHLQQPFGDLTVSLAPHDDAPRPIVIDKGTGQTWIDVQPGVELDLRATLGSGSVSWTRVEQDSGEVLDSGTWQLVGRTDGTQTATASASAERVTVRTHQPLTITQSAGDVQVVIYEPAEEER